MFLGRIKYHGSTDSYFGEIRSYAMSRAYSPSVTKGYKHSYKARYKQFGKKAEYINKISRRNNPVFVTTLLFIIDEYINITFYEVEKIKDFFFQFKGE